MNYFRVIKNGRIYNEIDNDRVKDLVGLDISSIVETESIDPPSVIDCINHGTSALAVHRYMEIHDTHLKESFEMINKMKDDIAKLKSDIPSSN